MLGSARMRILVFPCGGGGGRRAGGGTCGCVLGLCGGRTCWCRGHGLLGAGAARGCRPWSLGWACRRGLGGPGRGLVAACPRRGILQKRAGCISGWARVSWGHGVGRWTRGLRGCDASHVGAWGPFGRWRYTGQHVCHISDCHGWGLSLCNCLQDAYCSLGIPPLSGSHGLGVSG